MPLGTNDMTTTTGAVFIPQIWSKLVQKALEKNLVAANVALRIDSDAQQPGNVINFPEVSNLSANVKSAGSQVTLQSPTESSVTINLNKHYESSFLVEDRLAVQSKYALPAYYIEKAGYAIAAQIDTDILGLYTSLTNTAVGNSTSNITDATVLSAMNTLDEADVPANDRSWVFYVSQKQALLGIDKFVFFVPSATGNGGISNADSPIRTGRIGELYGDSVYFSTNVPITSSTFVHNLYLQKEAYAFGLQFGPRVQTQYKQEYLGQLYTTDAMYGVGTWRPVAGIEVQTQK